MKLTKEETLEGNKLIAGFMGYQYEVGVGVEPSGWYVLVPLTISGEFTREYLCREDSKLKYNNSWDWSMPVADKINSMGKAFSLAVFKSYVSLTVEKGGKFYKDFHFTHAEYITDEQTGKEAMFKLLVRFIKWQNEQADVLICENCKDFHIAPKDRCNCGSTTLSITHKSNIIYVK